MNFCFISAPFLFRLADADLPVSVIAFFADRMQETEKTHKETEIYLFSFSLIPFHLLPIHLPLSAMLRA